MPTPECQRCSDNGIIREALRLRVRWVQELSGRAAWELGERLAAVGELPEPELIRHMTLEHVEAVATNRAVVVPALVATHDHDFGAPLPAWFQLSDLGKPIRTQCASEVGGGTGAGGGVGLRAGHLRQRGPTDRLGARHHDAVTRAGALAATVEGHRVRDGLGAVPPRHPRPGGPRPHGGRLRRGDRATSPRARSSLVDGDTGQVTIRDTGQRTSGVGVRRPRPAPGYWCDGQQRLRRDRARRRLAG